MLLVVKRMILGRKGMRKLEDVAITTGYWIESNTL